MISICVLVAGVTGRSEQALVKRLNGYQNEYYKYDVLAFHQIISQRISPANPSLLLDELHACVHKHQCHIVLIDRHLFRRQPAENLQRLSDRLKPARCVMHMGIRSNTQEIVYALEADLFVSAPINGPTPAPQLMDAVVNRAIWGKRARKLEVEDDTIKITEIAQQLTASLDTVVEPKEVLELLTYLFREGEKITLRTVWQSDEVRPRTNSVLVLVEETIGHSDQARTRFPVLLKLGKKEDISTEIANFHIYIKGYVLGMRHTYLERYACLWKIGGIVYSFLGVYPAANGRENLSLSGSEDFLRRDSAKKQVSALPLNTFANYCEKWIRTGEGQIQIILKEVFQNILGSLYKYKKVTSKSLLELYNDVWDADPYNVGCEEISINKWPPIPHPIKTKSSWIVRLNPFVENVPYDLSGPLAILPNPARWFFENKDKPEHKLQCWSSPAHGDLHLDNILVDETNHCWLIDFERSGQGPMLQDFVELIVDVLTRPSLTRAFADSTYLCIGLYTQVAMPANPLTAILTSPEVENVAPDFAIRVGDFLKEVCALAYSEGKYYTDYRELLWGLLLNALYVVTRSIPNPEDRKYEESLERRKRAWLLASVLCSRLEAWACAEQNQTLSSKWPPENWPVSYKPTIDKKLEGTRTFKPPAFHPFVAIRIVKVGDKLEYRIRAQDNVYDDQYGEIELRTSPRETLQQTFNRLNEYTHLLSDATQKQIEESVKLQAEVGHNLYADIWTKEFKEYYRDNLRKSTNKKALIINSAEESIPWEVLRPEDTDINQSWYDDEHLCEKFYLARGKNIPQGNGILLNKIAVIYPPTGLAGGKYESEFLSQLSNRPEFGSISFINTVEEVLQSFRQGSINLYHFICHGNFYSTQPSESYLKLADGPLKVSQITGEEKRGLTKSKPLIFINACHSGEIGVGLTRIEGWSQRFMDSGASAFIGTLWNVNTFLAARFAIEFYERFLGLKDTAVTLGQAVHDARMEIKAVAPANPTWLAYTLYGHPNAYWRYLPNL